MKKLASRFSALACDSSFRHLRFRQTWDTLILIAVIYCSFIVPWDMCFQPDRGIELVAIDVAVEVR